MKTIICLIALCFLNNVFGQIDSVNTTTHTLKLESPKEGKKSYIVYLQDSLNGAKYNFEIWDRTISKNKGTRINSLKWIRHKNTKEDFYEYEIKFDNQLKPLSEQVIHHQSKNNQHTTEKKYFIYDDDKLFTSSDKNLHTVESFQRDTLDYSFNWELDLETLSCLPLAKNKTFAINFYHPGSKTPPQYYNYNIDRTENLNFNGAISKCWVVKVVYSQHQSSEFWIDQSTHQVLQMKEEFYGKYRFKKLII